MISKTKNQHLPYFEECDALNEHTTISRLYIIN